uniref:Restriction endonuclease n=1 Tax=Candidatus Kentrum sp. DK TaxID=2126562 RepID=A0A450T6H2_9GAMM|nr:MAG: Putative restriction endonuclease [Candidatus Kentron sp. DK]
MSHKKVFLMAQAYRLPSHGSFTVDQIREGERYELSDGHRIYCAPAGESHSRRNLSGGALLDSDPDVEWAGVDAGFSPNPRTMRAPDVSVAPPPPRKKGWISGAPPLAVEYADEGQDEAALETKIQELLAAGTRYIWVARLTGPYRVEVHTRNKPMRLLSITDMLEAPGILRNRIPVRALFDRTEAHRVTLKNLLQREGYDDIDAILQEGFEKGVEKGIEKGKIEGKAEGRLEGEAKGRVVGKIEAILDLLALRAVDVDPKTRERIRNCHDLAQLDAWFAKAVLADRLEDIFENPE